MTPIHLLSASEALRSMRAGLLTAEKLVRTCLEQIEQSDSHLHAWVVHLNREQAFKQARAVDQALARKEELPPLAGIPVGIKDIFNTTDLPTQMGSPIWSGFTPGNDARVVASLRGAGSIILGKTVTAEFAVHTPGLTVNPHNPEHSPGTSSSGSAAAVAAGMVPLSLGSQTAGSVIRPASYCGIYGFKPSFGLIPRTGSLKTTDTLDTVGFFARSSEDLELVFETIRVKGRNYPLSEKLLQDPSRRKQPGKPWRIALVQGPKWSQAEKYAQEALLEFASQLDSSEGITVKEAELPPEIAEAHAVHEIIYDKSLSHYFKQEVQKKQLVSVTLKRMILHGQKITLEEYQRALDRQAQLAQILDRWFAEEADLVLTLSTGGEAPKGLQSPDRPDSCLVWTLCGAPAISLPRFIGPTGLPFGAQFVARRYNDFQLLEFARSIGALSAEEGRDKQALEVRR